MIPPGPAPASSKLSPALIKSLGKRSSEWEPVGDPEQKNAAFELISDQLVNYTFAHDVCD